LDNEDDSSQEKEEDETFRDGFKPTKATHQTSIPFMRYAS
jgi:hypothetical protein